MRQGLKADVSYILLSRGGFQRKQVATEVQQGVRHMELEEWRFHLLGKGSARSIEIFGPFRTLKLRPGTRRNSAQSESGSNFQTNYKKYDAAKSIMSSTNTQEL